MLTLPFNIKTSLTQLLATILQNGVSVFNVFVFLHFYTGISLINAFLLIALQDCCICMYVCMYVCMCYYMGLPLFLHTQFQLKV